MRFVKSSPLEVGYRIWQVRPPQPSLSIAVKGTFDAAAGDPAPFAEEQLPAQGETHWDDDVERSLRHASDLPLFKPKGECVVVGKAWAPGGRPTGAVRCRFAIGPIDKELVVFGDRLWERGVISRITEPAPFTEMELSMERAYGGAGHGPNPYGRGRETVDGVRRLPNLEHPSALVDGFSSRPDPIVIGPLPMSWPARMRHAGTYDARYMRERWPWLPEDFDWRFYLAAPPDQRLREGYWRGDEPVAFDGLHPSEPKVRGHLPKILPRVFLDYLEPKDRFDEVPMSLDTVVWDAEIGRLLCVWRGMAEVPSESLEEIAHLFVAHDPLDGPHRDGEALRAEMKRRLAEEEEEERAAEGESPPELDDDTLETPTSQEPALAEAPAPEEPDPLADELRAQLEAMKAKMKELGLEPPPDAPAATPPDPKTLLERLRAGGAEVPAEMVAMVERMLEPEPERTETEPAPPPEPPPTPEGRALVEALLAAGLPLTRLDLSGVDLRGLDLSGRDLSESILRGAELSECRMTGATCVGTMFAEATMRGARLDGAALVGADLTTATLERANLAGAQLADAELDGANLRAAILEAVSAPRASFVGANLQEATMRGADFTEADFEEASLVAAQASDATFTDASFERARAERATFERCKMGGLRGEGLHAEEARFGSVEADDSFWERAQLSKANFSFAKLSRADFSEAVLIGAEMDGCVMREARFERANAHSLRARRADLMESVFESADLSFADLRDSNLFGAELWRANTSHADLELANLTRTKLA